MYVLPAVNNLKTAPGMTFRLVQE